MHRASVLHRVLIVVLLWLFAASQTVLALNPDKPVTQYVHSVWQTDDGLPQNYVVAVTQTPDGYIWLATQEGLLSQFSTVELNELPADYLATYRDKVRSFTPEDLLATARKYFDSANMQIVVAGDRSQIEEQAALFGEVEVFDNQGNRIQ